MGIAAAGCIWLERTVWRQRECHRFDFVNIRAKDGGVRAWVEFVRVRYLRGIVGSILGTFVIAGYVLWSIHY